MASLLLTPENQIQRLNTILNKVSSLREFDSNQLTTPAKPKSWSIIEVLAHLNIAYELYANRIERMLHNLPDQPNGYTSFKARRWQRFVINGTRPKGGQRKWKIKTLKKFKPLLEINRLDNAEIDALFQKFETFHLHLKNIILNSRSKDVGKAKIDSAIGPIIKFYLPECFEFLLAHLERHMVQIDGILEHHQYQNTSL